MNMGLFSAMSALNVCVWTLISYTAQYLPVPSTIIKLHNRILQKVTNGPQYVWTGAMLKNWKDSGIPVEARDMKSDADATMIRAGKSTSNMMRSAAEQIRREARTTVNMTMNEYLAIQNTDSWIRWKREPMAFGMQKFLQTFHSDFPHEAEEIDEKLEAGHKKIQEEIHETLKKKNCPNNEEITTQKIMKRWISAWGLDRTPEDIWTTITENRKRVSKQPRVRVEWQRAYLNVWRTTRRFQQPDVGCVFKCEDGARDDMEHDMKCHKVEEIIKIIDPEISYEDELEKLALKSEENSCLKRKIAMLMAMMLLCEKLTKKTEMWS